MAKKKSASGAAEKQLKAAVKKLQSQLAAAEKSAEKWKARAQDRKAVASGIKAELAAVRRRLEKAEASVLKWKDRASRPVARTHLTAVPDPAPTAAVADAGSVSGAGSVPSSSTVPDDSWTVTALRAEARRRGISNYSRKTKAQLLVELRG
jgi:septal ring factor EnvC (AmiA/AmiB activator)